MKTNFRSVDWSIGCKPAPAGDLGLDGKLGLGIIGIDVSLNVNQIIKAFD